MEATNSHGTAWSFTIAQSPHQNLKTDLVTARLLKEFASSQGNDLQQRGQCRTVLKKRPVCKPKSEVKPSVGVVQEKCLSVTGPVGVLDMAVFDSWGNVTHVDFIAVTVQLKEELSVALSHSR